MPWRQNQQSPSTPPIQETPTRVPAGEGFGCALHHFADDLMAGNDARMEGLEVALDDVEIGAADAAGDDFEQHFAGLGCGARDLFDGKPGAGSGRCGVEDGCAHGRALSRIRVAQRGRRASEPASRRNGKFASGQTVRVSGTGIIAGGGGVRARRRAAFRFPARACRSRFQTGARPAARTSQGR